MITAYDSTGDAIAFPQFIELQWNRRFNGFGDFALYMPASEYDSRFKFITNSGRPETGIIQKIVYQQKPEGDFVTLSGYFIEWLLNWGAAWKDISYTATTAAGVRTRIRTLVRNCMTITNPPTVSGYTELEVKPTNAQLYSFSLDASMPTPDTMDLAYKKGEPCGDVLLEWLNVNGYSMTATPIFGVDPDNAPTIGLSLVTYTGEDKSDQVIFGKEFNDVSSVEYVLDESAEKAEYMCIQEVQSSSGYTGTITLTTGSGTKRYVQAHTYTSANAPSGVGKAYPVGVIFTNAGGDTSLAQTSLAAAMRQEGRMEMLNNYKLETISVDVIQNHFKYLEDYDLGDTCGVIITALNKQFKAQIVEVHEVHANNKVDVQIVLGTPRRARFRR